jgi:hypothetical protein
MPVSSFSAVAASTTGGLSKTARYVAQSASEGRRRLRESYMLGLGSAVFEELATVAEDCRNADWDGYDALPVTQDTLRNAFCFLEALPLGTRAPSVGAEPDGHLTLEWYRSPRRTLSVSVSPEGDLHYAALFGPNRVYGTEAFFGDVPEAILDLIRRVYAA